MTFSQVGAEISHYFGLGMDRLRSLHDGGYDDYEDDDDVYADVDRELDEAISDGRQPRATRNARSTRNTGRSRRAAAAYNYGSDQDESEDVSTTSTGGFETTRRAEKEELHQTRALDTAAENPRRRSTRKSRFRTTYR